MSLLLALLASPDALAYSSGRTGSSTTGCTNCHGTAADPDVTGDLSASATTAEPGETLTLTFALSSADTTHEVGGLNVSASGGTLAVGSGTQLISGEITHTTDRHFASGGTSWTLSWTAPTAEGTYTLYSSGLAANHDHSNTGDGWDLDTVTITVDDGCDDLDGDGYEGCDDGSGADCDDTDRTVSPAAVETCDGVDENCDGVVDDDPVDGVAYWPDADGDTYGDDAAGTHACTDPGAGWVTIDGDCDDADAAVSPDAEETCDGTDEDCDGVVDGASAIDASAYYADADADTYGDPHSSTRACEPPPGYVADATDCDDARASINPAAPEVCDSLDTDENCDGLADDADPDVTGTTTFYADADADGYGGSGATAAACTAPSGYVLLAGDCDDTDAAYNPGAAESCEVAIDYNCDGSVGYTDADADGVAACLDCDDTDADVRPGATELCNAQDDDCDGVVDEPDSADASLWYTDADADGWGTTAGAMLACTQPDAYADNADDCDDSDPDVRPDAPEVWHDGIDQDCDGNDDDQDGDGWAYADDCDDTDPAIHPAADEIWYDGIDQDCDAASDYDADGDQHASATHGGDDCDDDDPAVHPAAQDEPYDGTDWDCDTTDEYDWDRDGFEVDEDCDDARSDVYPGAEEVWYDGIDQDCDGNDDDQDGDGVANAADCDDMDPLLLVDCDPADSGTPDDDTPEDTGACGCSTTSGVRGAWWALLALGAAVRRRK